MNAEILVNLNKKRDFYNKFSNLKINDKLSEYIYNESLEGDYNNKVIINITCKEKISDEEKQDMIDIIRKSYGIPALFIFGIGVLLGIALIIIYYTGFVSILKEVILMSGWLAICSSVYGLIFSSTQSFVKIKRLKNLSKARIYFN